MHSEQVEKKEQEFGYYPHIGRCAVCGYPIANRRATLLLIGALLCAVLAIGVIFAGMRDGLGIVLVIASIAGMLVFGYFGERESRAFHRAQRKLFLERLDQ